MCEECGCQDDKRIVIDKKVSAENDRIAHRIWHELKDKDVLCINLMGAPGSGKTTVIEGLSHHMKPAELAVIQGDLESDIDKKRLEELNIDTYQINTHSGCHLNADMIEHALQHLNLSGKKYLIIENVGNLVCPAGVKIGQHMNIVVSSTTEGSDKPKKYPIIFMDAHLILISKYDLKDAVDFDEAKYIKDIRKVNSEAKLLKTAHRDKESLGKVAELIHHKRDHLTKEHSH